MTKHSVHYWQNEDDFFLGKKVMFAQPGGGAGGGGSSDGPAAPSQQQAAEGSDDLTEKKLEAQRNRRFTEKLDKLVSQNKISGQVAQEAKDILGTQDSQRKALARMLANKDINENAFNIVNNTLSSEVESRKSLAQLFIRRRIDINNFDDALGDLTSGDSYRVPLAQKLAAGRIDQEEFIWARRYVNSADPAERDQMTYSQQLARGDIGPQEYRNLMNAVTNMMTTREEVGVESEGDVVGEVRIDIHNRIVETLEQVGIVLDALPESERTQPVQALYSGLRNLNTKERTNHRALVGHIRPLKESHNLTDDNIKDILEFDGDTESDLKVLRTSLSEMGLPATEVSQIMTFKRREFEIEKEFIKLSEGSKKMLEVVTLKVENDILEVRMKEEWSRSTGVTIATGTHIEYVYPDEVHGNVRAVNIQNVRTEYAPVPDKNGNVIGNRPINLTIFLNDGRQWTIGQFAKWVNAVDAYEVIDSQADMQQKLGLTEVGMNLTPGQSLEYRKGFRRDEKGHIIPQADTVKIREINDNMVRLSTPVETLNPAEDPRLGLTAPRMAAEMNIGEFAKWARRHDMVPAIASLAILKEFLRQHSTYASQHKFPNRNADLYPALTLEPGEWLQPGDSRGDRIQIAKADDSGVTFKGGDKLTLPQFFKWVRDNNIERANPDDIAARHGAAASNLGQDPEQAKKGMLKRIADALRSNNDREGVPGQPKSKAAERSPHDFFGQHKPIGPFKEIFYQYQFMSVMDLINMGKEIIEFVKRKHQRKSKMRYSELGKALPGAIGTEFNRVNQAAENEEVNQYKEAMGDWGTWEVLSTLHNTGSKDEAKACIIVLTEKGEFRWDDDRMWNTLNKLTAKFTNQGTKLFIPLTKEAQVDPRDPKRRVSGEDKAIEAMDALWGEGGATEWYSKNISTYDSKKSAFEHKGRQLEADPKGTGGLEAELSRLLRAWKHGEYVSPIEYEELVDFAISAGKLSSEQKLYFLMEGVTARCPSGAMAGMTLLHIDRIGNLDGKYLNQFPMLDYFTNKGKKPFHPGYLSGDITLDGTKKGYRVEDYEALRDEHFKNDSGNSKAGKEFSRFLWENMLLDENFQKRLSKGLRAAQNMDHDDAHMFIPPATMEDIDMLTGSHNGQQKYFTNEGYMNGYVGFNQFIVSLSNRDETLRESQDAGMPIDNEQIEDNVNRLMGAIQSFFLFDSYLDGRRDSRSDRRARLDKRRYDAFPVNDDSMTVGEHQIQLQNLIKEVCDAYGIDWKGEMLLDHRAAYSKKAEQEKMAENMENFLKVTLPEKIQEDGGAKMLKIVRERKLRATQGPHKNPQALGGIKNSNRLIE
jgi:hypothetical protein